MIEKSNEGLLVRAEPLEWTQEICQRMVNVVVRVEDGALFLKVDHRWAGAIDTVLVAKGVRVNELRRAHVKDDEERADLKW